MKKICILVSTLVIFLLVLAHQASAGNFEILYPTTHSTLIKGQDYIIRWVNTNGAPVYIGLVTPDGASPFDNWELDLTEQVEVTGDSFNWHVPVGDMIGDRIEYPDGRYSLIVIGATNANSAQMFFDIRSTPLPPPTLTRCVQSQTNAVCWSVVAEAGYWQVEVSSDLKHWEKLPGYYFNQSQVAIPKDKPSKFLRLVSAE